MNAPTSVLQRLPASLQWHVLRFLGWRYGDKNELQESARRICRQHYVVSAQNLGIDISAAWYRYAMPRWCEKCGEYREYPCIKCTFCGHLKYSLICWK